MYGFGCHSGFDGPPYGIRIPQETHQKFPLKVKWAWKLFDIWYKNALRRSDNGVVSRTSMPKLIAWALEVIKAAPIPGRRDGAKGIDSCYVRGVEMQLVD